MQSWCKPKTLEKHIALLLYNTRQILKTKEGFHTFFYTYEGRYVNEGLAALFTHRFARVKRASFSIAMNDYGIEMLSDQEIDIEKAIAEGLLSEERLQSDILGGINAMEMARRKFRDIAHIAGFNSRLSGS